MGLNVVFSGYKIIFYDCNLTETIIKNYMYDLYDSNINIYHSIEKKFYIPYIYSL